MAGLVPAIPLRQHSAMAEYYVYIFANRPGGAIYIGVTNDLIRRVYEHKNGFVDGFTKQYGVKRLVYFELYPGVRDALQRERNMKHWPRAWKTRPIAQENPSWRDLYDEIAGGSALPSEARRPGRARP
jgi:putative endonuclease